MSRIGIVKTAVLAALVAASGCTSRQVMKPSSVVPRGCEVLTAPADVPDTISVALFETPDPENAPLALRDADALVYHHLYETLITKDCTGEVRGALATTWEKSDRGRRWTFELRDNARFWNGKPVTAWDVEWWWRTAMVKSLLQDAAIDSIAVRGERVLEVTFLRRHGSVPPVLSSTAFAVAAPSYGLGWPLGTGPFRIEEGALTLTRRGLCVLPASGAEVPVIHFVRAAAGDARDLIENGVDALVTADPDVIDYAADRAGLSTVSLPWSRTYVLLSTARAVTLRNGADATGLSAELTDGLARDAVRRDARGSQQQFWWREVDDCGGLAVTYSSLAGVPAFDPSAGTRRVVYDGEDAVARDLAERIVALAAEGASGSTASAEVCFALRYRKVDGVRITAEGVGASEMERSLRDGRDFAYIIALPHRAADPCFEARKLVRRAPWVSSLGDAIPDLLIPLVDTRSHLIADGRKVGAAVDWYGNVLLYGWSLEGSDLP